MREWVEGRGRGMYSGSRYQREFQIVKDSTRLRLRKGDVVKVSSACPSKYARNQLGVIINRYRWVKFKYSTFADYGATIMFLTGKKKGCLKKFYSCSMGQLSRVIY